VENFSDEKIKPTENLISSVTQENEKKKSKIDLSSLGKKFICNSRCKICASEYSTEIYSLLKSGIQQIKIIDIMKEKHSFSISSASLSRHVGNLTDRQVEISSQLINHEMIGEAAAKSIHTQKTIELLELAFNDIIARVRSGCLKCDISDLERLLKMKYQILTGNDEIDKDILAIFQRATDKYGVNLQQGVMFGRPAAN
jgi:hypothetical protein